jgi:hypothetical protein
MAAPSILGIGSNSKAFTTATTRTSSAYTVTAPAEANTIILSACLDIVQDGTQKITGLSLGSRSPLFDISVEPANPGNANYRNIRMMAFDVAGEGAISETATLTFSSTSSRDILSVFATDGYVQNAMSDLYRAADDMFQMTITGDSSNTGVLSTLNWDQSGITFTPRTGTEIIDSDNSGLSSYGIYSTTFSSGVNVLEYSTSASNDASGGLFILTSKPNPFADVNPTGEIISNNVITN